MHKHVRIAILTCLTALLALTVAAPASAAPSPWSFIDVGLHSEQGQQLLLVSGELPETVPLPYEAELAVPAGTQLQWIGEILGGPPAQDPQLQYVKTTVGDMDVYTFTLTKSRSAQFEGIATGMTATSGGNQTSSIRWTALQDIPSVRLSQRVPRGTRVVQGAEGASMQAGDEAFSYYAKTVSDVKTGDVLDLTFAYALPSSAPGTSTQGSTDSVAVVIVGAMLFLLLGILVVAMRRKAAPGSALESEYSAGIGSDQDSALEQADTAFDPDRESGLEPEPAETAPARGVTPGLVMIGAFAAVVLVAVVALGGDGSAKSGTITKFFGSTSPCTSTSLALIPNQGVLLNERGEDIVDAFTGYDGIGDVTLTLATSTLDVSYCSSSHTEASVRGIVEGTGLVTLGSSAAPSAPATATADPAGAE